HLLAGRGFRLAAVLATAAVAVRQYESAQRIRRGRRRWRPQRACRERLPGTGGALVLGARAPRQARRRCRLRRGLCGRGSARLALLLPRQPAAREDRARARPAAAPRAPPRGLVYARPAARCPRRAAVRYE